MSVPEATKVAQFSWEENFHRSWEVIQEDEHGTLRSAARRALSSKEPRWSNQFKQSLKGQVKRGMIRHTCVVLDASEFSSDRDWSPSRFDGVLSAMRKFLVEYFEQNPISQLGLVLTRGGLAEVFSEMSGNAESHLARLKASEIELSGEPSLQNSLMLAKSLLK